MKFTRREFIGLAGMASLSGCRTLGLYDLPKPKTPWSGGPEGPYTFAVLNDFHLTDAKSTAVVSKAVNGINTNPAVRFTFVLGDMASTGAYAELQLAKTALDRLERPYYAVPGEHDVNPTAPENVFNNFESNFGATNWDEADGDFVFIGLNTCEGRSDTPTVAEERLEWLRDELGGVGNKRIVLLMHHPLGPAPDGYRVANADEVLSVFEGRNLAFAIAGHYHANTVEQQGNTTFVTTAACSRTEPDAGDTDVNGYRLFTRQEDGTLATEFVEV